ncbi:MAG: hydroxyacid dehydrogenase [Candidatus Nealsonbacteria bacterium]|nr:hydroxyacid dehydrogenase [Candidatus Nealsonbacteria bacterium]
MEKLKIVFLGTEQWEEDYLKPQLKGFDLRFADGKINQEVLKQMSDADVLSPFIYSVLDKKTISALKSLKYITTRSTGFDHINLAFCAKNNILVSNVPVYGDNTVAEHTFALILALSRKIVPSLERTRKGDFASDGLKGFDLQGKTLGVVGTGNIGRKVIKIASGFEMKILAFDIKPDKEYAKKAGFEYVDLDFLLKNSDIVTLHIPYNKATHHLVNLDNLSLFKKGCYLINTARGGLCDTMALLKGLEQKIFAGLGLDVLEEECAIKEEREILSPDFQKKCNLATILRNHILLKHPDVVITPHNAFNSKESVTRILETTVQNILSFKVGKPINLVK